MAKKPFKYQMNAYFLYKIFGSRPFYSSEAEEALKKSTPYKVGTLTLKGLRERGFIKDRLPKDEVADKVADYNYRKNYQKLTQKGLEYCKWLEDNKQNVTKYLLEL